MEWSNGVYVCLSVCMYGSACLSKTSPDFVERECQQCMYAMYVCMCVYVCMYVSVCMCHCPKPRLTLSSAIAKMYVRMYVCMSVLVRMSTCLYVFLSAYARTRACHKHSQPSVHMMHHDTVSMQEPVSLFI